MLALSGCVPVSSTGIYNTAVDLTVPSTKSSKDFALCAAGAFDGNNPVTNDGDHYWVTRLSLQGTPFARWDFLPTPTGSVAQLRSVLVAGTPGTGIVRKCA
jgi:hypothetical protein